MGITYTSVAREIGGLSSAAKSVLNMLAVAADEAATEWPSVATLQTWTGLSRRTVFRALAELETEGVIVAVHDQGKLNCYEFTFGTSAMVTPVPETHQCHGDTSEAALVPHRHHHSATVTPVSAGHTMLLKNLTTDDDDLSRSSSSSSLRPQKRKAPATDDGATYRLGLWSTRMFSARSLRNGAWHLGAEFGLHGQWAGFERWLEEVEPLEVLYLLQWLAYYGDKSAKQLDYINNLPGVLRKHIREDGSAPLNASQVEMLERYCSMPLEDEVKPVNRDEAYKRQSPAWVEPQEDMAAYLGMWR